MAKEKKEYKVISITLSQETLKKLEKGKYNRSKLIDSLLDEHFEKEEKKQKKE